MSTILERRLSEFLRRRPLYESSGEAIDEFSLAEHIAPLLIGSDGLSTALQKQLFKWREQVRGMREDGCCAPQFFAEEVCDDLQAILDDFLRTWPNRGP